jgi:hypothetical protein
MKNARLHPFIFIAVVALSSTPALASADDQPIEVNTDNLTSHVGEQVRQHAEQGEQALMQYLWFTRRVHHLWLDDVVRARPETTAHDEQREKHVAYEMHPHGVR